MGKILGLLGAAIAPPVAAFAFLQTWAKAHPVQALLLFLAYEAVVVAIGVVGKLVGHTADELSARWKDPLAKSIDERGELSAKFHNIALAVTLLERRADGRSLATETIVLATD